MSIADLDDVYDELPRRSRRGISTSGLILLGVLFAAAVVIRKVLQKANVTQQKNSEEQRRDKILKDTFPASDAPSSQYFDIPVNRQ